MARPNLFHDTREHILATGEALVQSRGFTAAGLTELLAAANVPKGSFYHYFKSKEDYGVALLIRYFDQYDAAMGEKLTAPGRPARERLLSYFEGWIANACTPEHGGCLVVKLAGEVCDLSEPMRETLSAGMARIVARLAEVIEQGHADGSISCPGEPRALADALYAMWLGAALRAKVERCPDSLNAAMEDTRARLTFLQ
ncbi:TetR/AcrR family transcriptional regulator [Crenobacter cavernae]|uniref:TetR/AcrR family transcriptional regulator n=1 Tax=Crenobacter cavernae TaxID=2290923 RepID=A0A345Y6P4_9NEIS|nr:TetR/AcrR family transcriptional regulator [Crenobacter cavernae]AXK39596.1 TetR/AcrR family transcriptional regulator [Crenobacter cavernae]